METTRYAVIAAGEALDTAVYWHPDATEDEAQAKRRKLDRELPSGAPYRVVRIRMVVEEIEDQARRQGR